MLYLPYEIWRDVKWYEWKYRISNMGNVLSINYKRLWYNKNLSLLNTTQWYKKILFRVWYNKEIKRTLYKNVLVHRLVWIHFLNKIIWKNHINHINWIRTDNRIENIERCTSSENHIHKYRVLWYSNSIKQRESARKNIISYNKLRY